MTTSPRWRQLSHRRNSPFAETLLSYRGGNKERLGPARARGRHEDV